MDAVLTMGAPIEERSKSFTKRLTFHSFGSSRAVAGYRLAPPELMAEPIAPASLLMREAWRIIRGTCGALRR
jgi:hypothetical protein